MTKKLNALKPNKVTAHDEIPPRLLGELADVLAGPIATIMKKSIQERNLPPVWKKSKYVVHIFKKENNVAGNYRPVSLTSATCKVLEGVAKAHGLFDGQQPHYGSTNLLAVIDDRANPGELRVC